MTRVEVALAVLWVGAWLAVALFLSPSALA